MLFGILPLYTNEETLSFSGAKAYDANGVGDLEKVVFSRRKAGSSDWVDVGEVTEFTTDSNDSNLARFDFEYDLSGLTPGSYELRAIAYDKGGAASEEEEIESFSVISDPGGNELSDNVKLAMAEAANLDDYDQEALALTRQWTVWITPGQLSADLAASLGANDLGATGFIPNSYTWEFPEGLDPYDPYSIASQLESLPGVEFAYPQVPVDARLWYQPTNERFFKYQWHLQPNYAFADAPPSITQAWDIISTATSKPVRGNDVVIGIVDDGLEYNHPDLEDGYKSNLSWDFTDNDADPLPYSTTSFSADISDLEVDDFDGITFDLPVSLTGMVKDVGIQLNFSKNLPADLPDPEDLKFFLVSPVKDPAADPLDWIPRIGRIGTSGATAIWFPGYNDLKFDQKTELDVAPDGTVKLSPDKFEGSYAGGTWKLQIQNPGLNHYTLDELNRISKELLEGWSLTLETANPHGTAVAGVAAASENGKGVIGVAPEAQLAGLRLIGSTDPVNNNLDPTGLDIANALLHAWPRPNQLNRNQYIDIFQNSWGPEYLRRQPLAMAALEIGAAWGRDGLGSIYVFAAGNEGHFGGNANYNYLANSRQTIPVGAITYKGVNSFYSTPGAPVLVSAYSDEGIQDSDFSIPTTAISEENWYAKDFGGTSAAAPFVSGVIALMLDANPSLTARDIQYIFAQTAGKIDVDRPGWTDKEVGYDFNSQYGFGAVDPVAAVEAAIDWKSVAAEEQVGYNYLENVLSPIRDGQTLTSQIPIYDNITVEHVEILFDADHDDWGDLTIKLVSPDGTESLLAEAVPDNPKDTSLPQLYSGSKQWIFSSAAHWGESSLGHWTLEVIDENGNQVEGDWNSWNLKIYGTKPEVTVTAPQPNASENGQPGQFTISRTGNTQHDLEVNYILGGTATNGDDYATLERSDFVIPAGQESVTVDISAIDDSLVESDETVKLTLLRTRDYFLGSDRTTEVTIRDNDLLVRNIVTNTNDSGLGSLRDAIEWGNSNAGKDTISFNIPTSDPGYDPITGAFTIQPQSALPEISDSVVIDATTQAGFSSSPIIELDGTNAGSDANGLTISAGNSTVRGLAINRFSEYGILLEGSGDNVVEGNHIGTDVTGSQALGNGLDGVQIDDTANNTIGGTTPEARNLISGNDARGISISGSNATGNQILGNYIGTDSTGTQEIGNTAQGVYILAPNNTVGGTTAGAGNLISGNAAYGVLISGVSAQNNQVLGNYIGTDLTGTKDLDSRFSGVGISNAPNNTVGGTATGSRNLISGNNTGVHIVGSQAQNNKVLGNYIGTDITGTQDLGNNSGVFLSSAPNNIVGGTTVESRNLISGNEQYGVLISGSDASGNQILGNYVGTDITGSQDLGNSLVGFYILAGASNNAIGGTASGAGNTIAFHDGFAGADGVAVKSDAGSGNAILGNAIFANADLGVDFNQDGVTPNDSEDTDTGPNNLQNFPVLTAVNSSGGSTNIEGTLNSTPNSTFRVELFSNPDADREGQTFLGFQEVTTDSNGDVSFAVNLPTSVPAGSYITATATDSGNNTSEFSQGIATFPIQFGTADTEDAYGVALDSQGNTYTVGGTNGSLYGPIDGNWDPFIVKRDSSGKEIWSRQLESAAGTDYYYYRDVAIDNADNIYTVGYDGGRSGDIAISKWNSDGTEVWTKLYGNAADHEWASGITTDDLGNFYIAGFRRDDINDPDRDNALIVKFDSDGQEVWTREIGGTTTIDRSRSIATDSEGNIYAVGVTQESLDGETNAGGLDIFATKYDTDGNRIWTRLLGTAADESPGEYYRNAVVAIDPADNIYIGGTTEGIFPGQTNAGQTDSFVAKLDVDGNIAWTDQFGGVGNDLLNGITVDSQGIVNLSGWTDAPIDGQSNSSIDAFWVRYDGSGNKLSTELNGSDGIDIPYDITAGNSNIYTVGSTTGDFGGANAGAGPASDPENRDAWILQKTISSEAPSLVIKPTKQWTRELGSTSWDSINDVDVDIAGNTYMVGWTTGDLDGNTYAGNDSGNSGVGDGYIIKHDANGNKLWTKLLGGIGGESIEGVTVDSAGDIYVVGKTFGSLEGDTYFGDGDAFFGKYDSDGNLLWSHQIGSANRDVLSKVTSDGAGNFYATGYSDGKLMTIKFDSDGQLIWNQDSDLPEGVGTNIDYDPVTQTVYVAGYGRRNLDGSRVTGGGKIDGYVLQYDRDGNIVWSDAIATPEDDRISAIDVDQNGDIHLLGTTSGVLDGNISSGVSDLFVAKISGGAKEKLWIRQFGTAGSDNAVAGGIKADANGNVFVSGRVEESPGAGSWDGIFTVFDRNGDRASWTETAASPGWDYLSEMVLDANNNLYMVGAAQGSIDGQPHAGSYDAVLFKYNFTQTYAENTPLDLTGIVVSDPDGETTVKLTLSNPVGGELTAGGAGGIAPTYDAATGVWEVSGPVTGVNTLLANLQFVPAEGFNEDISITVEALDEAAETLQGVINLTANDSPNLFVEPSKQWTRQLGSTGYDGGDGIALDKDGNVYRTGFVRGELDGQPYLGGPENPGAGGDSFITKYDNDGNKLWTRTLGSSTGDEYFGDAATDDLGNVYVAGETNGSLDSHQNLGGTDAFFAKYDPDGNLVWSRQVGTSENDSFSRVAVDSDGYFYTVGYTNGLMDGGQSAGITDSLLMKWDSDGNVIWTQQIDEAVHSVGKAVAYDAATNSIYIAGQGRGSVDGNLSNNAGQNDAFVARYDLEGNMIWGKQLGTAEHNSFEAIDIDADGNVYLSGHVEAPLAGNTGEGLRDALIVKYDSNGNLLWNRQFGTAGNDYGYGLTVDSNGNAYVSGQIEESPGAGIWDAFLTAFDPDGNRIPWTEGFSQLNSSDGLGQIITDDSNNIYAAGWAVHSVDGQPYAGSVDLLVQKYAPIQTYTENTPLDLKSIAVSDADPAETLTVSLTLSNPAAGELTVPGGNGGGIAGDRGGIAPTYDAATGVWTASGSQENINALLDGVQFVPAQGFKENISIAVKVSDGTAESPQSVIDLIAIPANNSSPNLFVEPSKQWTAQIGSASFDGGHGIALDKDGNVYRVGFVRDDLDGNKYAGGPHVPGHGGDSLIAKYDNDGNKLWTRTLGSSTGDEYFGGAVTDDLGNVYVAGETSGSLDGHENLGGSTDAFFAKYDPDGNLLWSRQVGTDQGDSFYRVAVDSDGYFYTVGYTGGLMEGSNSASLADSLLMKWDSDGNVIWTEQINESGHSVGKVVTYDAATNSIYIAGHAYGSVDGEPNKGNLDAFVVRYDLDGNLIWAKQLGTTKSDNFEAIDTDANGNVYVSGYVGEPLAGNTGEGMQDVLIAKYDSNGNLLWNRQFGSAGNDFGYGLTVDSNGNAYVGGQFDEGVDSGTWDAFLTAFDPDGNRIPWTQEFGNYGWDGLGQLATDDSNNIYAAGWASSSIDGQPHAGSVDLLVQKYAPIQTYSENTPLDLKTITVSDADPAEILTVTLTLSDPAAGQLTVGVAGGTTSSFDSGSGVWTASGSQEDINALLDGVQFLPGAGYNSNLTIEVLVADAAGGNRSETLFLQAA